MKSTIFSSNWFILLLVAILMAILSLFGFFDGIERSAYDWGVRDADVTPSDKIALIAIDDQSINNIGQWPWTRNVHAQMIDKLTKAGAKVIGYDVFFFEKQRNEGLKVIKKLTQLIKKSSLSQVDSELSQLDLAVKQLKKQKVTSKTIKLIENTALKQLPQDIQRISNTLDTAQKAMDVDQILAHSLKENQQVVLPYVFDLTEPQGNPDQPLPSFISKNEITHIEDRVEAIINDQLPPLASHIFIPIDLLGRVSSATGHFNIIPDLADGAIRTEPLVIKYYDQYLPSMALVLAAKSLNLKPKDIQVYLGEAVQLGRLHIKTRPDMQMQTAFYKRNAFSMDSFFDVLKNKIPLNKYKNKIVLIGATAAGVGDSYATPVAVDMRPIEITAHTLSSILNEDFFVSPKWAWMVEIGLFLFITLLLMFILPKLKAAPAAIMTLILAFAILAIHHYLIANKSIWLQLTPALLLLLAGYLVLITKRFFATERGKLKADQEGAESNKMLGLSLQGQGQLDAAFEKYRTLPMDNKVMELLYNLGLDFERKRQFNKAHSVYQYMQDHDPKFRDLEARLNRAKQLEETVLLGGASGSSTASLLLDDGGIEKPMLGRYEIEKELGKGAMGVVYLGIDPKINRTVAIKTMALSQEFEADELADVTARFFREAETAGRLNHPNIVTIFDAGEEHDLAYIAMEFIEGHDLARYTKKGQLMPPKMALGVIAQCADALHFAHRQNVVHRDIKPANIMYAPKTRDLKVTDFGIARITDSSKTKTGMVLGTPSYMSPEQLAGKKVDGRSDLFSLGVMMYQFLTGILPFKGDSMASLMFQIANDPHRSIQELNPNLPHCVAQIIDKALAKEVNDRYQTGAELNKDLKVCLKEFK